MVLCSAREHQRPIQAILDDRNGPPTVPDTVFGRFTSILEAEDANRRSASARHGTQSAGNRCNGRDKSETPRAINATSDR